MPAGTSKENSRQCEHDRLLDHSGQTFFTPNKKSRQHSKNRGDVGSLAGVFVPRMRLRDRKTKIIPPKPSNLRASRRDSHAQLAPEVPRGTRGSNSAFRLDRSTLARVELENHAQEQFVHGACGGLISQASSASVSSGSLGLAHVQSVVAACQSGQLGARDICVQPISPELSFLIFTVPYPMGLNAVIDSQDDHGSAASLGCYGGLENVIIKQIQSTMWLVAGTVRSSEISCADPKQKNDLMSPSNRETDSAYGDISDDCSHSPGEQFLEKNQRWSPEDDRILREWVENGRPWSWIIRQFPMRTPGSVRTRYSMLRRKPTQS
ncbi:Homeodomain-like protein [Macrophomina phaseolina MS6]|uniref:Homeodomain-like protein n=1 Tax=Macrophomina phaseolina (strain MS6) TaxID=1126212 RepID=K2S757_MACPH|nr:Homeodomain-like protein [Macrophomina phaseolina MS6]